MFLLAHAGAIGRSRGPTSKPSLRLSEPVCTGKKLQQREVLDLNNDDDVQAGDHMCIEGRQESALQEYAHPR